MGEEHERRHLLRHWRLGETSGNVSVTGIGKKWKGSYGELTEQRKGIRSFRWKWSDAEKRDGLDGRRFDGQRDYKAEVQMDGGLQQGGGPGRIKRKGV